MASNALQIFRVTLTRGGSAVQLSSNITKSAINIPNTVLNRTFSSKEEEQDKKCGERKKVRHITIGLGGAAGVAGVCYALVYGESSTYLRLVLVSYLTTDFFYLVDK